MKDRLQFKLVFWKLSSASDWIASSKECELNKSGHTFGLLAVRTKHVIQCWSLLGKS